MNSGDYAKAAGVAFLILAVNVLIAVVVVAVYAIIIEPGHSNEVYDEAAKRIAPWCSHIAGTGLFFIGMWFLSARQQARNAYQFALAVTISYAVIGAAIVAFAGTWGVQFALSMVAKLGPKQA